MQEQRHHHHAKRWKVWLGGAVLACASWAALAQTPLKIITSDQAGGGMDALIRPIAEKLATALARPVVVENRPGAQSRIAGQAVASSPPDGNTVLITIQGGIVINPHVYKYPYDTLADLVPVTDLGRGSLLLLTPASLPPNNFKELAEWIKAQPKGRVNYGTYSPGTLSHFGGLLMAQELGAEMTAVHYKPRAMR
jgi:tripartite-type tricarboxylate transporter receptor subunit TctC